MELESYLGGGGRREVYGTVCRVSGIFYYPDVAQLNTLKTTITAWNPNKLHNTGITRGCEL